MNRWKQLDAWLDNWAEARWPGIVARGKTVALFLSLLALVLLITWGFIYAIVSARGNP